MRVCVCVVAYFTIAACTAQQLSGSTRQKRIAWRACTAAVSLALRWGGQMQSVYTTNAQTHTAGQAAFEPPYTSVAAADADADAFTPSPQWH
jgi:hypothetical protein